MITIRKSDERGLGRHGWLTTRHTFSFANYYDPRHMGFRTLRVINEDVVAPGRGFGEHRHDNMEIISIVMSGTLAHRDSTGGQGVLRRGEVQHMSAGTGVAHSEFNGSDSEEVHFFQVWIEPNRDGLKPGYAQKLFPEEERKGRLQPLVSNDGRGGTLRINQDVALYGSILEGGGQVEHALEPGRAAWIQVAEGTVSVNGKALNKGDGAAIEEESRLEIVAESPAEILLFDIG